MLCLKQAYESVVTMTPCRGVLDGPICGGNVLVSPVILVAGIGPGALVFHDFSNFQFDGQ